MKNHYTYVDERTGERLTHQIVPKHDRGASKETTMVEYLETKIADSKRDYPTPGTGMAVDGYTKRSGAPSSLMIRLDGEKRWRRLMIWQFSNAGTSFVRIKGKPLVVRGHDIPDPPDEQHPLVGQSTQHLLGD